MGQFIIITASNQENLKLAKKVADRVVSQGHVAEVVDILSLNWPLFDPTKEIQEEQALRSFVASLALFETLVVKTGRESIFSLKWPNDVLLNGGKVAGILLQTVKTIMGRDALLIGIGVNLLIAPKADHLGEQGVNPVALFSETGMKYSPEAFLSTLMKCYARLEYQFQINGFSSIREAWLDKASHLGEIVTARLARQEIVGRFDTIDEKGHLVLQTAGGAKNIAAADVFF